MEKIPEGARKLIKETNKLGEKIDRLDTFLDMVNEGMADVSPKEHKLLKKQRKAMAQYIGCLIHRVALITPLQDLIDEDSIPDNANSIAGLCNDPDCGCAKIKAAMVLSR